MVGNTPKILRLLGLALVVSLAGCASQPKFEYLGDGEAEHPAMQRFVEYYAAVKQADDFEVVLDEFFHASTIKAYRKALGWRSFVYTASFKGIKNGDCEQLGFNKRTSTRREIHCSGTYLYKSIAGDSLERMNMRVNMIRIQGQWYVGNSGLRHTQGSNMDAPEGYLNDRWTGIGLKF